MSARTKTIAALKLVRFVGAVAMLGALFAGALGFGPETKLWAAASAGTVGVTAAAIFIKASHAFS